MDYIPLNRPTSIKRLGLAETAYGLDILGRVVAERAGAATVRTHVYDGAGRKQSVNVALPRPATGVTGAAPSVAMSFTYDASGNRTGATWSGGTVTWVHDGLNRIRQVSFGAEIVTAHAYDLLGRRTGTNRGPGANSAYAYDISSQLTGASHAWNGGNLNTAYGNDPTGQLTSEVPDNLAFLWQPAATLMKETKYDPASPINALTKIDGINQPYDARGNRLAASGKTYRYDTRNMLVGASAPGQTVSYGYYPEGGRAWKQVNGVTTLYLEVDGVEWGTYDAAGTLKERTIRASGAGGAVIATHSSAGLIRLLPNRQGSIIGWLRPDGKLGGAYTYDAYGNSPQAGAAGPQFRYAGMRLDAETGLYHTPFRAYDPQDGRWMQLDPAGLVDGLNRYAYVKNSPLMGVDPTGLISAGQCAQLDTCRKGKSNSELGGMLKKDQEVGALQASLSGLLDAVGAGNSLDAVKGGAHKPNAGETIDIDLQEENAADEGDRQTFYASRALRGEGYGFTGLEVVWNMGIFPPRVNGVLRSALAENFPDTDEAMTMVGIHLMRAHISYVRKDIRNQLGNIYGSLGPVSIARYHHEVFAKFNIGPGYFGGTPFVGSESMTYLTSMFWCGACDAN